MSDKQETIADIIAEKRRRADEIERDCAEKMKRGEMVSDCYARELVADIRREADRLEAAHRRELSKNASENKADFGQLGDAAKLREALKQVNELNDLWFDTFTLPDGATSIHDEIEDVISAALAAPPRNCDVGAAEEAKMETPECPIKSLSLDEAIAHADEVAGDCGTACRREHKQLADWLRELKSRRSAECGDVAKLRAALRALVDVIDKCDSGSPLWWHSGAKGVKPLKDARAALAAPPRNCDRPECATTKAAQDVWRREDGGKTAYYEWLLATYKEGGNDGR